MPFSSPCLIYIFKSHLSPTRPTCNQSSFRVLTWFFFFFLFSNSIHNWNWTVFDSHRIGHCLDNLDELHFFFLISFYMTTSDTMSVPFWFMFGGRAIQDGFRKVRRKLLSMGGKRSIWLSITLQIQPQACRTDCFYSRLYKFIPLVVFFIVSKFWFSRALGSDDVSLNITHCGICYADVIWTRNGIGDSKYPLVPGYVACLYDEMNVIFHIFSLE